jgi:lysophospholipase L1-like esterase
LQFGVNVVPYVIKDYTFYEEQFYNQLKLLKSIAPGVSILVVGVSDMSRKEGELYVSYPNIEKIRDAQRRAAFKAGCAFWDLYEAMGGENSMPSWVFAKPALANKDFTHFTAKGASLVSEMLYKALLSEYEKFNSL